MNTRWPGPLGLALLVATTPHCAAPQEVDAVDLGFAPSAHPALPSIDFQGGPVLRHPHLVTMTYPGFAFEADVVEYSDWIVQSEWLERVGSEYHVGRGTHTHVVLEEEAPAAFTQDSIEGLLRGHEFLGTVPSAPDNGEPLLYMLFVPSWSTIADYDYSSFCGVDFAPGYHWETTRQNGAPLVFAVIQTCEKAPFEEVAMTFSHELIEAATNPLARTREAYRFIRGDRWYSPDGGEVADLCVARSTSEGHTVTQVWSNAAARAGRPPCISTEEKPFFNVSPRPDTLTVRPGGRATVELTGWSTAPVPDWIVGIGTRELQSAHATVESYVPAGGKYAMNNGTTVRAVISVSKDAESGSYESLFLVSYRDGSSDYYFWPLHLKIE